jgi:hypothetical protein
VSTRKQTQGHLTVVQPPQPPAKPPSRGYADFDKWVALGHSLGNYYDRLAEAIDVPDTDDDREAIAVKKLASWRGLAEARLAEWPRDKLAARWQNSAPAGISMIARSCTTRRRARNGGSLVAPSASRSRRCLVRSRTRRRRRRSSSRR